jgi:hypothetical protein
MVTGPYVRLQRDISVAIRLHHLWIGGKGAKVVISLAVGHQVLLVDLCCNVVIPPVGSVSHCTQSKLERVDI